jgi:hypothetical protein
LVARLESLSASATFVLSVFGCGSSPESSYGTSLVGASTADVPAQGVANIPECQSKPTTGAFPPDVAAVLHAKCQTCHSRPPVNHAPFPLVTYEDTLKTNTLEPYPGVPIWRVMHQVIQTDGVPHMPFGNAPQLTSSEFRTLDGWLVGCATPVADGSDDDAGNTGLGDAAPDAEVGNDGAPPEGAAADDAALE